LLRRALAATLLLAACGGGSGGPDCSVPGQGAPWLAFTSTRSGNYDVWLVRSDGQCLRQVTTDPGADHFPAWSPDGRLAFSSTRTGGAGVYLHDLTTGLETGVPILDVTPAAPAFSPAGPWLAFEGRPAGSRSDLYKVLATGGAPTPLTAAPGSSASATWSPDGAAIYFVSSRTGDYRVYAMDSSGGAQAELPGTSGVLGRLALSPDGTTLAWSRQGTGGAYEVVAYQLPAGPPRVVTSLGDGDPSFDPSGTRLAISSSRGGAPAIWLVDLADGGHPVRVTSPPTGSVDGNPVFRR
jgi:TolB protein